MAPINYNYRFTHHNCNFGRRTFDIIGYRRSCSFRHTPAYFDPGIHHTASRNFNRNFDHNSHISPGCHSSSHMHFFLLPWLLSQVLLGFLIMSQQSLFPFKSGPSYTLHTHF